MFSRVLPVFRVLPPVSSVVVSGAAADRADYAPVPWIASRSGDDFRSWAAAQILP
ncbi:MAG TPA: hypothetical protein VHH90_10560 [Polyangia bacterium]|nr:hypothetical protein [Polyangia bacterium]